MIILDVDVSYNLKIIMNSSIACSELIENCAECLGPSQCTKCSSGYEITSGGIRCTYSSGSSGTYTGSGYGSTSYSSAGQLSGNFYFLFVHLIRI